MPVEDDRRDGAPTRDGIYRLIVALMAADVVVGLGLAAFGGLWLHHSPVVVVGGGLALIGALLLLFFLRLGAQAERRQR
ncbi:MAG: hypothetical protein IRY94_01765 [Rhodospirillaceae bacterium]|nr:hypothetical protein [Rhodospirillaceae bacterium]